MHCYTTLEQLEPAEPRWLHLHAAILAGYGEVLPAIELLEQVVQLAPSYRSAWLLLGDCRLKANQLDRAVEAYESCLKKFPDDPFAWLGLARIDLEKGRDDAARAKLENVVRLTNYQLGYDLIVSLYERAGMSAQAAAIRGSAKASGAYRDRPDPWLDELMVDCFDSYRVSVAAGTMARNGDMRGALPLIARAIELAPLDVRPRFQRGSMKLQVGDLTGAEDDFERCTSLAPAFADGWAQWSDVLRWIGDNAGAARVLAAGLRSCPESPGLHLMRARQWRLEGRNEDAIRDYVTSAQLRPGEPEAYVELGTTLIDLGRVDEGIEQLQHALQAEPSNPLALGTLAFHAILSGDEASARRWLTQVNRQPRMPAGAIAQLRGAFREKFGHD